MRQHESGTLLDPWTLKAKLLLLIVMYRSSYICYFQIPVIPKVFPEDQKERSGRLLQVMEDVLGPMRSS